MKLFFALIALVAVCTLLLAAGGWLQQLRFNKGNREHKRIMKEANKTSALAQSTTKEYRRLMK